MTHLLFAGLGALAATMMAALACGDAERTDPPAAKAFSEDRPARASPDTADAIIARASHNDPNGARKMCRNEIATILQSFVATDVRVPMDDDWCEVMVLKSCALNELKRSTATAQLLKTLFGYAPHDPIICSNIPVRSAGMAIRHARCVCTGRQRASHRP